MKLILRSILALAIAGSPLLAGQEPKPETKPKQALAPEAKPMHESKPKAPGRDVTGPRLFHRKTQHPKAQHEHGHGHLD